MKTRSNDIISNAPFKYESDSNTLEVGTNLYVDGKFEVNDDVIFRGNLDGYNDSALTFYLGDNAQTPYMAMSPIFDRTTLSILYGDGQEITTSINLDVSVDAQILTNKNVKTLFGNNSIYGSGNIDLYRHQLTAEDADGVTIFLTIISSNGLKIDSLQDLSAVTKPKDGYQELCYIIDLAKNNLIGLLRFTPQGIWQAVTFRNNEKTIFSITSITDVVTTI